MIYLCWSIIIKFFIFSECQIKSAKEEFLQYKEYFCCNLNDINLPEHRKGLRWLQRIAEICIFTNKFKISFSVKNDSKMLLITAKFFKNLVSTFVKINGVRRITSNTGISKTFISTQL
jgi:hypothetical protein